MNPRFREPFVRDLPTILSPGRTLSHYVVSSANSRSSCWNQPIAVSTRRSRPRRRSDRRFSLVLEARRLLYSRAQKFAALPLRVCAVFSIAAASCPFYGRFKFGQLFWVIIEEHLNQLFKERRIVVYRAKAAVRFQLASSWPRREHVHPESFRECRLTTARTKGPAPQWFRRVPTM